MSTKLGNPPDWIRTALEDVAQVELGKTPGRGAYSDSGDVKIVKFRDLGADGVDWSNNQRGFLDAPPHPNTPDLRAGDVLVTASAHSSEHVGRKVVFVDHVPREFKWVSFVGELLRVRAPAPPNLGQLLRYYLMSKEGYREIQKQIRGGHLLASQARQIRVPLCGEQQQNRIVGALDSAFSKLDAAGATLERARANLKRYRASVLTVAVEGRLVPSEAELARKEGRNFEPASVLLDRILGERHRRWEKSELARMKDAGKPPKDDRWKSKYKEPIAPDTSTLPQLPDGWCWTRAEQISDFITKGTTPQAAKLTSVSGDVPFIKVYNLTFDGSLNFGLNPTFVSHEVHEGELSRSKVQPGDVLMNIVGPPLGKVSVVPQVQPESNINQAIVRFRPVAGVFSEFLSIVLRSQELLARAIRQAKATAGQFNLTLEICRDMPIPLAPTSEQARIVAEVDRLLSVEAMAITSVEQQLRRSASLRQSILKWAFEGKLVNQDPNDGSASVLLERIHAERAAAAASAQSRKTNTHEAEVAK